MNYRTNKLTYWWLAIRPRTLWAAVSPVAIGSSLAYLYDSFSLTWFFIPLVISLLIQMATNLHNDWADSKTGVDSKDRLGPIRVTQAKLINPNKVLIGSSILFAFAGVFSTLGIVRAGWPIVVILVASILTAISYTGKPFRFGYHGLGEFFVLIFFGPVAVGTTYFLQTLTFNPVVIGISIGPGLLATGILIVNNLRDYETDAKSNKKTLTVKFGKTFTKIEYLIVLLTGTIMPPLLLYANNQTIYKWFLIIPIATIIPALIILKEFFLLKEKKQLNELLAKNAQLLILQAILIFISILLMKLME